MSKTNRDRETPVLSPRTRCPEIKTWRQADRMLIFSTCGWNRHITSVLDCHNTLWCEESHLFLNITKTKELIPIVKKKAKLIPHSMPHSFQNNLPPPDRTDLGAHMQVLRCRRAPGQKARVDFLKSGRLFWFAVLSGASVGKIPHKVSSLYA